MIYNLLCNNCNNYSSNESNTNELFKIAEIEGFKIIKDINISMDKNNPYNSITTTSYKYICPICNSSNVKLNIVDKDKASKNKYKYLKNIKGDIDFILTEINNNKINLQNFKEIYNNNNFVDNDKKTINIFKKNDEEVYLMQVLRNIEDDIFDIDYVDDNTFKKDMKTMPEFNMDNIYDLYDQEYIKHTLYNLYLIEFTSIKDLFRFIEKSYSYKLYKDIYKQIGSGQNE